MTCSGYLTHYPALAGGQQQRGSKTRFDISQDRGSGSLARHKLVAALLTIVGSRDAQLEEMVRGIRGEDLHGDVVLTGLARSWRSKKAGQPDVLLLDVRRTGHGFRRSSPRSSASIRQPTSSCWRQALNAALMLEGMRAGVNGYIAQPLKQAELTTRQSRACSGSACRQLLGPVFAFVGAKGGVGTTTTAVNVATSLATL